MLREAGKLAAGLPWVGGQGKDMPLSQEETVPRAGLWNKESVPRILPFALFMGFIGIQQAVQLLSAQGLLHFELPPAFILYPIKTLLVGVMLVLLRHRYSEIRLQDLRRVFPTLLSVGTGLVIFVLWIHLDYSFPILGNPDGFDPNLVASNSLKWGLIATRLAGAVLVVPVMEELFWRSFLIRYLINSDYDRVPIGTFSWFSFIAICLLFGSEHYLLIAGIMAGIGYNLLLYRTKSIAQCILSHALTNLCLGIYVLYSGKWFFW